MRSGMWRDLVATLLPVVVAVLTTVTMEWLQRVLAWLDRWPPAAKRVVVVLLSFVATRASTVLGLPSVAADITALEASDVSALLSGGLAYLFHLGDRVRR